MIVDYFDSLSLFVLIITHEIKTNYMFVKITSMKRVRLLSLKYMLKFVELVEPNSNG